MRCPRRPRGLLRTRPAAASACRCLVTAWRVTGAPVVRLTIESGPSVHSRVTSSRRVSSPSAAKTGAASARPALARLARGDMALDITHLLGPAAFVHAECFGTATARQAFEAGFDDGQPRPTRYVIQAKFHQGRRLCRVVHRRADGVRMPAIGEQPLGLDALDLHLHRQVLVARVGDAAPNGRAGSERALELHAKPGAELLRARDRAPDARTGRAQDDALLDPVRAHICNLKVAY